MKNDQVVQPLNQLRMEYERDILLESNVPQNPFPLFEQWIGDAMNSGQPEPNAMHLSTVDADGMPSGRIVLLRGCDERGLTFYTNYNSDKGRHLEANPRAAATFFWPENERQIRITGQVSRVDETESDAYFQSRPVGSRLGAWASAQSQPLTNREELEKAMEAVSAQFADPMPIPRPPHWGGYRLKPTAFEFWQGRRSRLHDRLKYSIDEAGAWTIVRLSP
jgi:pyridoxamine 5'-phosphate oxidase